MGESIPCKCKSKESQSDNSHFGLDYKIKNIMRDNEGHYIEVKGSNQEEDLKVVNMHPT